MTFDRYSAVFMGPTVSPVKGPGQVDDRRERRRLKKRDDVALMAIRMFADRGFDAVTVDEIAEAADIAPRTFFRYFPSKDDVLFSDHAEKLERLRELIAASPADEPILTTMRHAIETLVVDDEVDDERMRLVAQVVTETPALQARAIERQDSWEDTLAAMVAERLGVDAATDLRPRFVAAATLAAMRSAVRLWVEAGGQGDLITLVDRALDLLDGGLHHESALSSPRHGTPRARRHRS